MLDGVGEAFEGFDVWRFLGDIWEGFLWLLGKVWEGVNWVYLFLEDYLGEFGAIFTIFAVIFFFGLIVFVRLINTSQSGIEDFSHGSMGLALKIFAVVLLMLFIVFVLSKI